MGILGGLFRKKMARVSPRQINLLIEKEKEKKLNKVRKIIKESGFNGKNLHKFSEKEQKEIVVALYTIARHTPIEDFLEEFLDKKPEEE